jgi:G6PDH family F420-dependent oxidoreductase
VVQYGYKLMTELHGPTGLVRQAVAAEEAGFDFCGISDHIHPWLPEHQHSPNAWVVLGGIAERTSQVELITMVTCPLIRYHPVLVAHQAATVATMSGGRFTLGLGAGERLNEHVVGEGWPPVDVRHEMLGEAIDVLRHLWDGGFVSHRGPWFTVEDARIYDVPEDPIPIAVAASGPASIRLAVEVADGIVATEPQPELVHQWRDSGGDAAATWTEVPFAWAPTRDEGLRLAHERMRFSVPGWPVMAELPNPSNFAAATAGVRPEDLGDSVPAGPDPEPYVEAIRRFTDAGFQRIAVLPIGDDVDGFLRFWTDEVRPALG